MTVLDIAWSIIFALTIVVSAIGIVITHIFMKKLKQFHFDVWEKLGSYHPIKNNTIVNSMELTRFITLGRYKRLNDSSI